MRNFFEDLNMDTDEWKDALSKAGETAMKYGRIAGDKAIELGKAAGKQVKRAGRYVEHYGAVEATRKAVERGMSYEDYDAIRMQEIATEEELSAQRAHCPENGPKISILVPVYNPDALGFTQMLSSVKEQTYANWELCIADASDIPVEDILYTVFEENEGYDPRVKYTESETNLGIAGNTNLALALADGDYVAFLDQDDILEPNALYEVVQRAMKGAKLIYTDEDKVNNNLEHYERPFRKPDYNETLIYSTNYICHFLVLQRSIANDIGGLRSEFDGAQDYDLVLRALEYIRENVAEDVHRPDAEAMKKNIAHVDRVLYHWRKSEGSASADAFEKEYAYRAGQRALEEAVRAREVAGRNLEDENTYDTLRDLRVRMLKTPGYYQLNLGRGASYRYVVTSDPNIVPDEDIEYVFFCDSDMTVTKGSVELLVERAMICGADIVAAKLIKDGKYFYNGIAKAGKGHTISLKGKPSWHHGPYQIGVTDMDVDVLPAGGILVRRELMPMLAAQISAQIGPMNPFAYLVHINRKADWSKDLKMVYAPEVEITIS